MRSIKTAIVGCGMISGAYLDTLTKRFSIIQVVACYDRSEEKAKTTAEKYGIQAMRLEDILADTSIEMVVNLLVPSVHYEYNKKFLKAGKHVYTEKVLALEPEQARELVQLAREKELYLGAAPDTFLGASIQTARAAVDAGLIGEVTSFHAVLTRNWKCGLGPNKNALKAGNGIATDVGIYYLTAILSILGGVETVTGIMETKEQKGTLELIGNMGDSYEMMCENLSAGILKMKNGAVGTMLFDSNSVFIIPEKPVMTIHGTQGVIYMSDPNLFGGDVYILQQGMQKPVILPQSHPFTTECRGLGAAEMAWAICKERKHRANADLASHAVEVLYGMRVSGEKETTYHMISDFEKTPALPKGYVGLYPGHEHYEENAIAL